MGQVDFQAYRMLSIYYTSYSRSLNYFFVRIHCFEKLLRVLYGLPCLQSARCIAVT